MTGPGKMSLLSKPAITYIYSYNYIIAFVLRALTILLSFP